MRSTNLLEPFKAYLAARVVDESGFCLDDELRSLGYALSLRGSSARSAKRGSGAPRSLWEIKGRVGFEICHPRRLKGSNGRSERERCTPSDSA